MGSNHSTGSDCLRQKGRVLSSPLGSRNPCRDTPVFGVSRLPMCAFSREIVGSLWLSWFKSSNEGTPRLGIIQASIALTTDIKCWICRIPVPRSTRMQGRPKCPLPIESTPSGRIRGDSPFSDEMIQRAGHEGKLHARPKAYSREKGGPFCLDCLAVQQEVLSGQ